MSRQINQDHIAVDPKEWRGSRLPVLTNRWLQVNDVNLGLSHTEKADYRSDLETSPLPESFDEWVNRSGHGISEDLLALNRETANFERESHIYHGDQQRIRLPLTEDQSRLVDRHYLVADEGHCGSLTIETFTEGDVEADRNGLIYVRVKEDAIIRLVLVNRFNDRSTNNLSIIADVEDGGILHISQVELGGRVSNINYSCDLTGIEAMTTVSCAYIAEGDQKLDLFYNIRHLGPYTDSDIQVNGALLDRAKKSFRGTIDFLKGSYGSKGNEEEFAILMSPEAHSVAVPLLLAGEDDVEGNHSASAGRIDEDMLFYIMSRGLTEKEAEGLVVEARMVPTLDRIHETDLRDSLRKEIHERIVKR